jgi:hypothetical protein
VRRGNARANIIIVSAMIPLFVAIDICRPYRQEGLLVADLDLSTATGLLASRCRTSPM